MNIEVEIKVKIEDIEKFKIELKQLTTYIKNKHQIDEYFTAHNEDFFAPKNPTKWFRIRREGEKTGLHFHLAIHEGIKHTKEYETNVENYEMMKKILEQLKFKHVVTVDKEREEYETDKLIITIDKIKDLGTFVEVEAKNKFETLEEARSACLGFIDNMDIKYELLDDVGYPMLILRK